MQTLYNKKILSILNKKWNIKSIYDFKNIYNEILNSIDNIDEKYKHKMIVDAFCINNTDVLLDDNVILKYGIDRLSTIMDIVEKKYTGFRIRPSCRVYSDEEDINWAITKFSVQFKISEDNVRSLLNDDFVYPIYCKYNWQIEHDRAFDDYQSLLLTTNLDEYINVVSDFCAENNILFQEGFHILNEYPIKQTLYYYYSARVRHCLNYD